MDMRLRPGGERSPLVQSLDEMEIYYSSSKEIWEKQSLIKSVKKKIHFSDIFTSHLDSKPQISIKKSHGEYDFHASLSHETDFAIGIILSKKII